MNKRISSNIYGFISVIILIWLDQWTKALAVTHLKNQDPFVIINNVFEFHYLENRGAAFGIMQGKKVIFVILTILIMLGIAYLYNRVPTEKKFYPLKIVGVLIGAGAVGNLIDRLAHSYVVDFLYFKLIDFPIFNVADCYVTVAAALLIIVVLFVYKDSDLDFIPFFKSKKKKEEEE